MNPVWLVVFQINQVELGELKLLMDELKGASNSATTDAEFYGVQHTTEECESLTAKAGRVINRLCNKK